jgi:starch synthase
VYVVMVAPECAPAAKAGGLGDVVSGLSRELELRGHAVEIVLPKYASMRYPDIWDLQPSYRDLWVPWYGERVNCTVWFGYASGRKCFFIEPHSAANFFGRDRLYGYWDDAERFAFARPREFRHLAAGCMQADYSWRRPGQDYLAIYGHLRHR